MRGWEFGRGDPVLLVHGFTGSVEAWGPSLLRAMARENRVVAVDLLGHGSSDAPAQPERYALSNVLADLGRMLDGLGLEHATWIGYSMGGRVALAAAILTPNRVDRMVLESASPGIESEPAREARRQADHALARELEAGGMEAFVDAWMSQPLFATQRSRTPAELERARTRRLEGDAAAWAACLRGLGTGTQPSFWSRLAGVQCPTLVLTGAADAKFTTIGDRMAAILPNARRAVVPNAGHQVHFEAEGEWLRAVGGFLNEEEGRHGDG